MSLVRFCSTVIVRNKVSNCISPVAAKARSQVQFSWLASGATTSDNRRNYHSSSSGQRSNNDAEQRFLGRFLEQRRGFGSQPPPGAGAAVGQRDPLDTGFSDPNAAFKSKTLIELIRAYVVYMICSSAYLVENNMKVRNTSMETIRTNNSVM